MSILSMTDPDKIWSLYIEAMNAIVNTLAPTKVVQFRKDHGPYVKEDVRNQICEVDKQLEKSITTKDMEKWRLYCVMRYSVLKTIEMTKKA